MNAGSRKGVVAAVVAVIFFFGLSSWLQAARDSMPLPTIENDTLYLTERAAGRGVFTHRTLAADLYWIRALQYYGGRTHTARLRKLDPLEPPASLSAAAPISFDQLYSLLDITTTLDPRFNIAYRFGAIFLAAQYPEGPGRPDLAIALLEKGLKTSPEKWQYWHDIGFVYYWNRHDFQSASKAFQRASEVPGAPWWLRSLAATMLFKGGDRQTSRLLWRQLAETAVNDVARKAADLKLAQLDALEQIEQLQRAVDAASARLQAPVTNWGTLIAAGVLRGIPADPTGVPYELQSSGRVEVSSQSTLYPLPVEPGASTHQ